MLHKPKNRCYAFAIHMLISFVIFLALAANLTLVWYPGFLFTTDGGWQGIRLLIGVDLVIGPLLTLLVFKPNKPGLKFDLSCIAVVQAACLVAGVWIVYSERPIAVVYAHGHFNTMAPVSFQMHNMDIEKIPIMQRSKPVWIYVEEPQDPIAKQVLLRSQLTHGPLYTRSDRYLPYRDHVDKVLAQGLKKEDLQLRSGLLQRFPDSAKFYPLKSRYGRHYLVLDGKSGDILDTISL